MRLELHRLIPVSLVCLAAAGCGAGDEAFDPNLEAELGAQDLAVSESFPPAPDEASLEEAAETGSEYEAALSPASAIYGCRVWAHNPSRVRDAVFGGGRHECDVPTFWSRLEIWVQKRCWFGLRWCTTAYRKTAYPSTTAPYDLRVRSNCTNHKSTTYRVVARGTAQFANGKTGGRSVRSGREPTFRCGT